MLKGLFLDPRSWKIDFQSSPFWKPEQYGVKIDLHPNAFNISNTGVNEDYKFVLCSEVWEIPLRKTLQYLRNKGLKIFLIAREPFKTDILKDAMFSYDKFLYNNEYYFKPDAVFAAGKAYADLWQGKVETVITGYPRFDYYVAKEKWRSRDDICKQYGIDKSKKIIYFPSYPPYHYKKEGGKDILIDLFKEQEDTISALEEFSNKHKEYQVIIKIHPVAWKLYSKNKSSKDVSGLMKKYLLNPQPHIKVIGDERMSGTIAKELLTISDTIVGFTSTMLLEAAMINKSCIHILFGKTQELKEQGIPQYYRYLPTAVDKDSLNIMLLDKTLNQVPAHVVEDYFYKIDGKACERICKAIIEKTQ